MFPPRSVSYVDLASAPRDLLQMPLSCLPSSASEPDASMNGSTTNR